MKIDDLKRKIRELEQAISKCQSREYRQEYYNEIEKLTKELKNHLDNKNTLEKLLNNLIEIWREPRWEDSIKSCKVWECFYTRDIIERTVAFYEDDNWTPQWLITKSLREICSRESWLWQFVCDREHRFIDKKNYEGARSDKRLKNPYVDYDGVNTEYEWITSLDYEFRLIEASLKDESELEEFLLQSIKIDE